MPRHPKLHLVTSGSKDDTSDIWEAHLRLRKAHWQVLMDLQHYIRRVGPRPSLSDLATGVFDATLPYLVQLDFDPLAAETDGLTKSDANAVVTNYIERVLRKRLNRR